MCCECWKDDGAYQIDNDLVRNTLKAIEALYEIHPTGGYLHIVLDDNNVKDHHLKFCEEDVEKNIDQEDEYSLDLHKQCLKLLKLMSYEERISVLGLFDGCW